MRGFVESVSASAIEGTGNISFDEWDVFNEIVNELSVLYFKQGRNYNSIKGFISCVNKNPQVKNLEEQQRYFVETAARIYFYSQSLGLGSDFIEEKLRGTSLSNLSLSFVWNVLFSL